MSTVSFKLNRYHHLTVDSWRSACVFRRSRNLLTSANTTKWTQSVLLLFDTPQFQLFNQLVALILFTFLHFWISCVVLIQMAMRPWLPCVVFFVIWICHSFVHIWIWRAQNQFLISSNCLSVLFAPTDDLNGSHCEKWKPKILYLIHKWHSPEKNPNAWSKTWMIRMCSQKRSYLC